jgi:hypothetical protein
VLDSVLGPVRGVELSKKVSPLGRSEYSYDVKLNASANMFYLLKHLLLLNLVILKTIRNNLNSTLIRVFMLHTCVCCILASSIIT